MPAGLADGLKKWKIGGQRFLLLRADIATEELAEGIALLGAEVDEVAVYNIVPPVGAISQARQMLVSGEIDVITFTSSSTVTNLMAAFNKKAPVINSAIIACIGPKTAETAAKAGLEVSIVATEHTIPGLVAAISDYFRRET